MSHRLVIFDVDGTLIDSRRDLATAVNLVRGYYGLDPLPVEVVAGFVGDGIRNLVKRSLAGSDVDLAAAVDLQRRFYSEHMCDETVLYPGVEAGLRTLRAHGCILATGSNKAAGFCERILAHFGIRELFAHVAGDGNSPELKPHPGMYLEILRKTGVEAGCAWAVGDNHTDIEAARRAGIRSVFVTYGFGTEGGAKPDAVCASFDEVVAMFPA
ncbi:MAG: HAD-IA family hydrolase [bacterium]